jgi:hypothetical protein
MRNNRQLNSLKQSRVIIGKGTPERKDGNDGDFRLNITNNGVKLYAKYNGEWISFVPEKKQAAEADITGTASAANNKAKINAILAKLRLAGIIDDRIKD